MESSNEEPVDPALVAFIVSSKPPAPPKGGLREWLRDPNKPVTGAPKSAKDFFNRP